MHQESQLVDEEYLAGMDPAAEVRRHIEIARTIERQRREEDWRINWAHYRGQPWWYRGSPSGGVRWVPPAGRPHIPVFNLVKPRIDTLVGNETFVPKFIGRNTAQVGTEDNMRVRAAGDMVNHAARASGLADVKSDCDFLKHLCGLSWVKVEWDSEGGPMAPEWGAVECDVCAGAAMVTGVDGLPAPCPRCSAQGLLPDGQDAPQPGSVGAVVGEGPEGELRCIAKPPWEIFSEPVPRNPFMPRWLADRYLMAFDEVMESFAAGTGLSEDDIPPSNSIGSNTNSLALTSIRSAALPSGESDLVEVTEFYKRMPAKHPKYPGGIYIVMAGEVVLRAGPMPWAHRRIPYVPFHGFDMPGTTYPLATADALIQLQLAHMRVATAWQQHVEMSSIMRVIMPADVSWEFTDQPGVTKYMRSGNDRTSKPELFRDSGVPSDTYQFLDRTQESADESSYSVDALRGVASGSEDTATYAALREERATNPLKRMYLKNAKSLSLVGQLLGECARAKYRDGRMLRDVFGSAGKAKLNVMDSSRIGSIADVEMIPERDLGRTLASRRAEIIEAQKAGVFQDPFVQRLAEFGSAESAYDDTESEETVALGENEQFRTGEMVPPPFMLEGHDAHLHVHRPLWNEFRRTLGPGHPQTMAVYEHIMATEQLKEQEAATRAMWQQQAAAQNGLAAAAEGEGAAPAGAPPPPEAGAAPPPGVDPGALVPQGGGPPGSQAGLQTARSSAAGALDQQGV